MVRQFFFANKCLVTVCTLRQKFKNCHYGIRDKGFRTSLIQLIPVIYIHVTTECTIQFFKQIAFNAKIMITVKGTQFF